MKIGTIKESRTDENRVALSPGVCKQLIKSGFECYVEKGAGANSYFLDEQYAEAGAHVVSADEVFSKVDVICKVNPLNDEAEIGCDRDVSCFPSCKQRNSRKNKRSWCYTFQFRRHSANFTRSIYGRVAFSKQPGWLQGGYACCQ